MSNNSRTGGQSVSNKRLVLPHEVSKHSLLGGDLVHFVDVHLTHVLDVDGSAVLVGLVVVLGVQLGHLLLLLVPKVLQNCVGAELLSPLFAVLPHFLGQRHIELSGSQEPQQRGVIGSIFVTLGQQDHLKLTELLLLLGCQVTGVAGRSTRGDLLGIRCAELVIYSRVHSYCVSYHFFLTSPKAAGHAGQSRLRTKGIILDDTKRDLGDWDHSQKGGNTISTR